MASIKIRNIGPIKKADFNLNKINVFMGPQSSGKSTIAKICSQCSWYEKNHLLTGGEYDFYSGLLDFHRMDEGYFSDNSEILYESDWIIIRFRGKGKEVSLKHKNKVSENPYENLKVEYIPAERNFAATIPNLEKYSGGYDNIINFLNDWISFKETITQKRKYIIPLKSIDVNYNYDSKSKKDILTLANNKTVLLQRSSSGQQSIIPLIVVCEFMFTILYSLKRNPSPAEKYYIRSLLPENMRSDYDWLIKMKGTEAKSKGNKNAALLKETELKIWNELGMSTDYNFSNVIIEEPEQNLFPETQKELTYFLLSKVNDEKRNHKMILTTHSPYILYALNNCLLGGLVQSNIPDDEKKDFESKESWINPDLASIWEIKDGHLRCIQDKDNIISENYFDIKMTELTDEYFQILNYYQDEE